MRARQRQRGAKGQGDMRERGDEGEDLGARKDEGEDHMWVRRLLANGRGGEACDSCKIYNGKIHNLKIQQV